MSEDKKKSFSSSFSSVFRSTRSGDKNEKTDKNTDDELKTINSQTFSKNNEASLTNHHVISQGALPFLILNSCAGSKSPRIQRPSSNSSLISSKSFSHTQRPTLSKRNYSFSDTETETETQKSNTKGFPIDISTSPNSLGQQSPFSTDKSRSLTNLHDGLSEVHRARSRSYLLGSVGPTSLLGPTQLNKYLPNHVLRVFVGTWNMNGSPPPCLLTDFLLPQNIDYVPDLLVIGTQETMSETVDWEVSLQETLGPSHVLFTSQSLGTLHYTFFLRRDLIWFCSLPEFDSLSTRNNSNFKTKGAIAVSFLLFGTSFLFVNCHLTPHEENVKDRLKDLRKINTMLHLSKHLSLKRRGKEYSEQFDVVFWIGDLNFRLEQTRDSIVRRQSERSSVSELLEYDQLNYLRLKAKLIFQGFEESPITFPPTFKYDVGTRNTFDTSSKQRTPSYTDRILYKANASSLIKALHYDSVEEVKTSDHKPVWGMWEVVLIPGSDSIPLAGGLFNRAVYLEGLKRRSEALQPHLHSLKTEQPTCSLQ